VEEMMIGNFLEGMVGRDGIEPPTPEFSGLVVECHHHPHFQHLAFACARRDRSSNWQSVAPCHAASVTVSVTSAPVAGHDLPNAPGPEQSQQDQENTTEQSGDASA
jgi:hypothetical protein